MTFPVECDISSRKGPLSSLTWTGTALLSQARGAQARASALGTDSSEAEPSPPDDSLRPGGHTPGSTTTPCPWEVERPHLICPLQPRSERRRTDRTQLPCLPETKYSTPHRPSETPLPHCQLQPARRRCRSLTPAGICQLCQ